MLPGIRARCKLPKERVRVRRPMFCTKAVTWLSTYLTCNCVSLWILTGQRASKMALAGPFLPQVGDCLITLHAALVMLGC